MTRDVWVLLAIGVIALLYLSFTAGYEKGQENAWIPVIPTICEGKVVK